MVIEKGCPSGQSWCGGERKMDGAMKKRKGMVKKRKGRVRKRKGRVRKRKGRVRKKMGGAVKREYLYKFVGKDYVWLSLWALVKDSFFFATICIMHNLQGGWEEKRFFPFPISHFPFLDSSDETKKSESTGKQGTGKKRVGKTGSTYQDPGALHSGSRTRSMNSVESHKAGSCLQNSGTLSGGVKENQSISKNIACNAEQAMYEQDPIELSSESDGSTGRDSTKSTKGKCKKLTCKAGLAPQDPGNLHGTTTFTLTNIIKSLDVTAASKKFEAISCQPATTKARTPTATQTSIHLKNLGDFGDGFLCTSNSQYSEPEPCLPVKTAPTQYGAMSKVIPVSTLKTCTELVHQAIVPVVETVPPSSSKSNRLKQEEPKNISVSVSNYFLWIPI